MKINNWLNRSVDLLAEAGIATARLDVFVLIEDETKKDRAWLLAHPEFELTMDQAKSLDAKVERRAQHEPLAYIRGKSEFYGREFMVNPHTLEPRPETETMIDLLKTIKPSGPIIDVGTGSGCLAITAKLEFPDAAVYGTDVDAKCVETARQNAKKLGADVSFYQGDLIEPVRSLVAAHCSLLCNLPYVPDGHTINRAAMFEPKHAIFGGADGLDLYRRLFSQIAGISKKPAVILTEALPFQHEKLTQIAERTEYRLSRTVDFIQLFKLI